MSTPFQNRLVGTVIVAAAAIIFLPNLLDGKKQKYQQDFAAIPDAPELAARPGIKQFPHDRLAAVKQAKLSDESALDEVLATETSTKTPVGSEQVASNSSAGQNTVNNGTIVVKAAPKPEQITQHSEKKSLPSSLPPVAQSEQAWVIQLGSFRHKKNVDQLLGKLKSNGYVAFSKPIKTKNGTLTKVFVGPEIVKSALTKKIAPLEKLTKVKGKIARFTPTQR